MAAAYTTASCCGECDKTATRSDYALQALSWAGLTAARSGRDPFWITALAVDAYRTAPAVLAGSPTDHGRDVTDAITDLAWRQLRSGSPLPLALASTLTPSGESVQQIVEAIASQQSAKKPSGRRGRRRRPWPPPPPWWSPDGDEDRSPEELAEACGGCAKKLIPGDQPPSPPTTPSEQGAVLPRHDRHQDLPIVAVDYLWPGVGTQNTCEYQILKDRQWLCIWVGEACAYLVTLKDDKDWRADYGSPGVSGPTPVPGVIGTPGNPAGMDRPGLVPFVRNPKTGRIEPTPVMANAQALLSAALAEGYPQAWIRYIRCTDFWSFLIDLDECVILSSTEWHIVIDLIIDPKYGRASPSSEVLPKPAPGAVPPTTGRHVGLGSIAAPTGPERAVDKKTAEGLAATCKEPAFLERRQLR